MRIERQIKPWGETSLAIVIPPDLLKHLGIKRNDILVLQDEEGKHGNFCSFWKKKGK